MKQITKAQLEDIVEHISDNIGGYIYNSAAQNIAPTEATTTTSQEYKVGEQFYYNKILYTATVPIANGGTIVTSGENKNCEPSPTLTKQLANLGTASTKNSTSVVTDSSDLVESGAVKDIVGWGNKNIGVWNNVALSGDTTSGYKIQANGSSLIAPIKNNTDYTVSKKTTSFGNRFRIILFKNEPSTTPSLEAVVITDDVTRTKSTFNSGVYNYVVFTYDSATAISQDTAEAMIELGSVKTAYEPYHASVEEYCASKQDVKDIVGWGNKNLIDVDSRNNSNVTSTLNDTTLTINTSNNTDKYPSVEFRSEKYKAGKYIFTANVVSLDNDTARVSFRRPSNYTTLANKILNNGNYTFEVTLDEDFFISIFPRFNNTNTSSVVIKDIMLRKADVTDSTYEPYHASVEESKVGWDEAEGYVLGKNKYSYPYGTRQFIDDSGNISDSNSMFLTGFIPVTKDIVASFSEKVGSGSTVRVCLFAADKTFIKRLTNSTSEHTFEIGSAKFIRVNVEDSSIAYFKNLMIRDVGTSSDYEPFVVPNTELTQTKADNSVIGTVEDGANPTKSYAVGEHMVRGGRFCTVTVPVTTSSTWVEGSNYTSGAVGDVVYMQLFTGDKNISAGGSVTYDVAASDIPFTNYDILNVSLRAGGSGAYLYCTAQWIFTTTGSPIRVVIYNSDTSQARDFNVTIFVTLRVK